MLTHRQKREKHRKLMHKLGGLHSGHWFTRRHNRGVQVKRQEQRAKDASQLRKMQGGAQ